VKKNLWKIFTILWASIIIYLSFFTTHQSESSRIFEHQDKAGHVVFYAVLTYGLIKVYRQEIILQQPSVIASIVSFIFGIVIEFIQHYITTNRVGSIMDVLANGFGIILILILLKRYPKLFSIKP
tara:strand:- start:664 stop:1038 length:375 start_codon:yes stop_codon:yes gene_type:complete